MDIETRRGPCEGRSLPASKFVHLINFTAALPYIDQK